MVFQPFNRMLIPFQPIASPKNKLQYVLKNTVYSE